MEKGHHEGKLLKRSKLKGVSFRTDMVKRNLYMLLQIAIKKETEMGLQ